MMLKDRTKAKAIIKIKAPAYSCGRIFLIVPFMTSLMPINHQRFTESGKFLGDEPVQAENPAADGAKQNPLEDNHDQVKAGGGGAGPAGREIKIQVHEDPGQQSDAEQ